MAAQMKEKTAAFLHAHFADSFKREVDADEAVWRSLPFFAAIMALAVAILPTAYAALSVEVPLLAKIIAVVCFMASVVSFLAAGRAFRRVIILREYVYPPNDAALLSYAQDLTNFHVGHGMTADQADEAARDELRTLVLGEFARATSTNRRNNNAKASARSQVLLATTIGFVMAFLCETTISIGRALTAPVALRMQGDPLGHGRDRTPCVARSGTARRDGPGEARAASSGADLGRRESDRQAGPPSSGGAVMSDEPRQPPAPHPSARPEPERSPVGQPPARPEPEWLTEHEEPPRRRP